MFSRSFLQYSWNSEVETTWKSLICWRHRTSITYNIHIGTHEPISTSKFSPFRNKEQNRSDASECMQLYLDDQSLKNRISSVLSVVSDKRKFNKLLCGWPNFYWSCGQGSKSRSLVFSYWIVWTWKWKTILKLFHWIVLLKIVGH